MEKANAFPSEMVRTRSLFDAFADVFTPPEDLDLYQPETGTAARERDLERIGEDFRKAIGAVMGQPPRYSAED